MAYKYLSTDRYLIKELFWGLFNVKFGQNNSVTSVL